MDGVEHVRIALAWLTVSDEEFAEGRQMQASEKLWGATAHALTALAMDRGWRYGRHRDFVSTTRRLSEESGDVEMVRDFNHAREFHANFYQGQLGDEEMERLRPVVRQFVRKVLDSIN